MVIKLQIPGMVRVSDIINHSHIILVYAGPVFTDATKMANIKNVRNCDQFKNNLIVQRAFGDICLAYQLHIRCELEIERQRLRMQEEKLMQDREQEIERVRAALQEKDQQEAKLDRQIEEERRKKKEEVEEERRNNEAAINALEATFDKEREDLQKKLKASEDCKPTPQQHFQIT